MTKRVLGTGAAGDLPVEQGSVAAVEVVEEIIEDVVIIDEDDEDKEEEQ